MSLRVVLAMLLFTAGVAGAAPLPEAPGFASNLTIYLAKGPPGSCGPGCEHWIAVEGRIDQEAAARFRRFMAGVKDTSRPIYFNSPGGAVDQAYSMGRLLRSRKAVARIGRTVVAACSGGTEIDAACLKLKTAGGEVEATIESSRSMCNSACVYVFLGAPSREVAPDAAMAVHNSKLTLSFHGHPSAQQVAEATRRQLATAGRDMTAYIRSMGIDPGLDDLIKTVKFETMHLLTRSELYRFGIDRRDMVETAWWLQGATPPYVRKVAFVKRDDGTFRIMEWRLLCENRDRARMTFLREADKDFAGQNSVFLMANSEVPVTFERFLSRTGAYEGWSGKVPPDAVKSLLAASRLQMGEDLPGSDGEIHPLLFDIGIAGLGRAWTELAGTCTAPPDGPRPAIASPNPWPVP